MTLWDATLAEFRERVASTAPTPGGGSVASVCGTLGVGLLVMALEISRARAGDRAAELDATLAGARDLLHRLAEHADRDAGVFQAYMAALALPRASDEQTSARAKALADCALSAAEAPLAAADDMVTGIVLAEKATHLVKSSVMSDVLAGADLLAGSVAAALRNVDINLGALGSNDVRERVRQARDDVARRAEEAHGRVASAG